MSLLSSRFALVLTALALSAEHTCLAETSKTASADLDKVVKPFFAEHCTNCHGAKKQKGDLRVDNLIVDLDSPKTMGHWEEIMNRINSGADTYWRLAMRTCDWRTRRHEMLP